MQAHAYEGYAGNRRIIYDGAAAGENMAQSPLNRGLVRHQAQWRAVKPREQQVVNGGFEAARVVKDACDLPSETVHHISASSEGSRIAGGNDWDCVTRQTASALRSRTFNIDLCRGRRRTSA
jgi:hypothetical protein